MSHFNFDGPGTGGRGQNSLKKIMIEKHEGFFRIDDGGMAHIDRFSAHRDRNSFVQRMRGIVLKVLGSLDHAAVAAVAGFAFISSGFDMGEGRGGKKRQKDDPFHRVFQN